MGTEIEIAFAPDGSATVHVAAILTDLFEDYRYFEREAERLDRDREPLLYKRMVRASILSFFSYFDGVLNRWLEQIGPGAKLPSSAEEKAERILEEINKSGGRPLSSPDFGESKILRNKIVHLKLGARDPEVIQNLLSDQFFRDAIDLHNWLRVASRRLGLDMHDNPRKLLKLHGQALGQTNDSSNSTLSDEDEELARMAEMTFLELDDREAADEHP